MMKIQVQYDVPVSAVIDMETSEVEDVIVWCEGVEQRDGEDAVVIADTQSPAPFEDRQRALEIVDSAIWPAWEIS
jgi:hypothetical protein